MRVIHGVTFSPSEIEHFRHTIFENITRGLRSVLDAMGDMSLAVDEANRPYVDMLDPMPEIQDGEPFPSNYCESLKALWNDPNVIKTLRRGNEAALPEKWVVVSHLINVVA